MEPAHYAPYWQADDGIAPCAIIVGPATCARLLLPGKALPRRKSSSAPGPDTRAPHRRKARVAHFSALVRSSPVYRLGLELGGNCFRLLDSTGSDHTPGSLAGLYAIFTRVAVVYFGEASDLCRRQLKDPDNTADSTKTFTNQGRAVLKLLLHRGWLSAWVCPHFSFSYIRPIASSTRSITGLSSATVFRSFRKRGRAH